MEAAPVPRDLTMSSAEYGLVSEDNADFRQVPTGAALPARSACHA